jgi:hypothetical protein
MFSKLGVRCTFALVLGMCNTKSMACQPTETVYFQCELKGKAKIELCLDGAAVSTSGRSNLHSQSTDSTIGSAHLTFHHVARSGKDIYRFSALNTPSMHTPTIYYSEYVRPLVTRQELRWLDGELEHTIFWHSEADVRPIAVKAGWRIVQVKSGQSKLKAEKSCRKVTVARLSELKQLLLCDPDSGLGIDACSAPSSIPLRQIK